MIEMFVQIAAQFAAGLLLRFRGSKPTKKLKVVSNFDIERFLGTWYLAAYIPPPFHKKMSSASTEYSRSKDGTLKVTNRSYDKKKDKWIVEETAAKFKDSENNGWLVVDAANPLDENRKIIYLNEDYTQAIVAGLVMRTIWITYRDPHLEMSDINALIARADEFGFKTGKLIRVDQSHDWKSNQDADAAATAC